jgi:hypothetical protein
MSFRRQGKKLHDLRCDWAAWLETVGDLIQAAGLPRSVVATEEAWSYFVGKTYSEAGYHQREPWFEVRSMTASQRAAFWELLSHWLADRAPDTPEYRRRSLEATYKPPAE